MNDNYQSDFKDTDAVRKYASRYNIYSLLFALGIFFYYCFNNPLSFNKCNKVRR